VEEEGLAHYEQHWHDPKLVAGAVAEWNGAWRAVDSADAKLYALVVVEPESAGAWAVLIDTTAAEDTDATVLGIAVPSPSDLWHYCVHHCHVHHWECFCN